MTNKMLREGKTLLLMTQALRDGAGALLTCPRCRYHQGGDSYPEPPPRTDLKPMVAPDNTKAYDACWQSMRRTVFKCRSDPEFNLPAFIEASKACLGDPCAGEVTPSDITKYKPSDMGKRRYQRTWSECVVKSRKRKATCVHKPPNPPRRKRKVRKTDSCAVSQCVLGKADLSELSKPCKVVKPTKCPRIQMPNCCVEANDPPSCVKAYRPPSCKRRRTKYPSFSECIHDPLIREPPKECKCLVPPAVCEMWRHFKGDF